MYFLESFGEPKLVLDEKYYAVTTEDGYRSPLFVDIENAAAYQEDIGGVVTLIETQTCETPVTIKKRS